MSEYADEAPHRYDAQLANQIEPYWQDWWAKTGAFETPNPGGALADGDVTGRRKLYVLDMFPYPSGAGLHVGHPLGYIGTDVYARFRRMRGDNVLHPFGYDAFGLPAEQYAIETGTHPRVTTEANIANMRRQLRRLGLAHDPRREFATTDPTYYRWTQWIFLRLFGSWFDPERGAARPIAELEAEFEAGIRIPDGEANPGGRPWTELPAAERRRVLAGYRLAYVAEAPVNWCPGLGTVLANEEVTAEGRSAIGNYPVFKRPLRQWMLRITAYAERLLDDLNLLDWPESIKTSQRNWIGRSEGADVDFPVVGASDRITVFTTRPDTLFGATYMVLAPEHPLVDTLVAEAWPEGTPEAWRGDGLPHATPAEAVGAYRDAASRISDRERMADTGRKTGVFTGGYAVNPTNGQRIPVFVADYVLLGYGTGAIMAVPAHDQRDFDFARKFGLPMTCVIAPAQAWLDEHGVQPAAAADPWSWPESFAGDGVAVNSANQDISLDGLGVDDAKRTIIDWLERAGAGSGQVSYRLRDWLFSRQRYWGEPFPIVWDEDGLPRALPESALPVELPQMEDFRPAPVADDDDGEPQAPLARATEWATVTVDLGDGPRAYRRELNTMPQWAGSCWYYLRFLDPANDRALVDPGIERYWTQRPGEATAVAPVDLYVGGVEHAVLHLLYARFWHKVLFDLGDVQTPEPFARLFNQGYILAAAYQDERGLYVPAAEVVEQPDGSLRYQGGAVTRVHGKMGKSLKNSVTPDEITADYGADTLRLYEMAMGPFDMDRPWSTEGLAGSYRFLQRLWRNLVDEASGELHVADVPVDPDLERALHRTIDVVGRDIDGLRFNTAIARLMEFNNALTSEVRSTGRCPAVVAETLVLLVAPLAPHVAEELWHRLGHDGSVAAEAYPVADPELLRVEEITLPVGVDGKVRFTITVPAEADEASVREAATSRPELARWLSGKQVSRVIVVPGRIVNLTTRPV